MANWLKKIEGWVRQIDLVLLSAVLPLVGFGLITMNSFSGGSQYHFSRQLIWLSISLLLYFVLSCLDWRFLRRSGVLVGLYLLSLLLLIILYLVGHIAKGAQSWLSFAWLNFQPADLMKLVLIGILAKYFSRRHIEIAHFRHIFISGLYAVLPFVLILFQPDFGSALIIFFIWLGMIMVAGVSLKHLLSVFLVAVLSFIVAWLFVFAPYQKARLVSFIHPLADISGSGYNAFQSMVAVGSGQLLGKGVGFGTQSRLKFLPEYQTDFIFAAFAEEWGLVGVLILLLLFATVIWRVLANALVGATNFETLFGFGLAIMFLSHFIIHVGMNIGILPVTGLPMPFVSYGGSHLLAEFMGLGILMGMRNYSLSFHRDDTKNEFIGPQ